MALSREHLKRNIYFRDHVTDKLVFLKIVFENRRALLVFYNPAGQGPVYRVYLNVSKVLKQFHGLLIKSHDVFEAERSFSQHDTRIVISRNGQDHFLLKVLTCKGSSLVISAPISLELLKVLIKKIELRKVIETRTSLLA